MRTPHHEHLETAFLQLSFAIKLWHYLDEHPFDKDAFDIALTLREDRINLPANEFHDKRQIQLAAANNISIVFGVAAITVWEAIREYAAIVPEQLDPKKCHKDELAALSYMLRCCFAHGTAIPVWSIRNAKYKTTYHVGNKTINLTNVGDNQKFDAESIGGYETLWMLRAEAQAHGLL